MELEAPQLDAYEYLDAGDGARLERFGSVLLERPSPPAIWARERPELWGRAAGVYRRSSSGGGRWTFREKVPESWTLRCGDFTFLARPTGFGHVGFFPEHAAHWEWLGARIRRAGRPLRVLNLFAYTGSLTLQAARAGAEVCHVDAVPDINDWARRNAELSGLRAAPVRWITDDVAKFVAREQRRNRRYDGVILDPPSYGKGPRGEKWILEEHLPALLERLLQIMSDEARFVLFTCHTLGFSPPLMRNLLIPWRERLGGQIEAGTMLLTNRACRRALPCGFFARWQR